MGLEGKPGWILSWSIMLSWSIVLSQSIILSCCIPLANMSVGCRCCPHPRAPARWVFFSLFPSPRAGSGFWKVSRILCIFPEILEPDVALRVLSHQLPRGDPTPNPHPSGLLHLGAATLSPPSLPRSSFSSHFNSFSHLMVQQLLSDAETCTTHDRPLVPKASEEGAQGEQHPLAYTPSAKSLPKISNTAHLLRSLPHILGDSPTCPWGQSLCGCASSRLETELEEGT